MYKAVLNPAVSPGDDAVLRQILDDASRLIVGKQQALRLALTCVLARGHLLIEDIPGVGKTTLAHVLARLLGLDFRDPYFLSHVFRLAMYNPRFDSLRNTRHGLNINITV